MELNERKRSQYSKRPKGDQAKETQLSPSQSHHHQLTQQQEISIMVAALKQVISGVGDNTNINNDQRSMVLSLPDSDTCRLCRIDGCLGCNLFSLSKDKAKAKARVDKNLITTKKRNDIGVVDFFPYPNNPSNQNSQQQQQQLERNNKKQRQETVLNVPEISSREDQKPFLDVDDEIQSWISMDYVDPLSSTPSASS